MHDGWRLSDERCVCLGARAIACWAGSDAMRQGPVKVRLHVDHAVIVSGRLVRRARLSFTPKLRTYRPLSLSCAVSSLLQIRGEQKLFAELIHGQEAFTFHFATRNTAATTRWG